MTTNPWRPLLAGEAALRAFQAVEEIAADLQQMSQTDGEFFPAHGHSSLSTGWPGIALFFAYLDQARPGRGHGDLAISLLERAFEGIQQVEAGPSLYGGLPGVAWVLEHFEGWLFESDGEDPGEDAARFLAGYLAESPWRAGFGLLSGVVGLGVYAIERLPRSGGSECLALAVARLAELAERGQEGAAWRTPPEFLLEAARESFPHGHYNMGVALGVAGVIAFLGNACAAGVEAPPLLAEAVRWMLAREVTPAPSLFPWTVEGEVSAKGEKLAWCYGDLGIASCLHVAARATGEPAWTAEALRIAKSAAERPIDSLLPIEANLCHGAAGAAHLFNRFFQWTGDPVFAQAGRRWLGVALDVRRPGTGIGGFRALGSGESGELVWEANPGFQTGAAGVGLALLAAVSSCEPRWDRLLLAS